MNIDCNLKFEFFDCEDVDIEISERDGILLNINNNKQTVLICNTKLKVPNQLKIKVSNISNKIGYLHLASLSLGGLNIDSEILSSQCLYTDKDTGESNWLRDVYKDGTLTIDFWAKDWLQYHLLIGNKIKL